MSSKPISPEENLENFDDDVEQKLRDLMTVVATIGTRSGLSAQYLETIFSESLERCADSPSGRALKKVHVREHTEFFAQMVGIWRTHPDYVDSDGSPKTIPRHGNSPSLSDLFNESVNRSVELKHPITEEFAVDALLKHSAIQETESGEFEVITIAFKVNDHDGAGLNSQLSYIWEFALMIMKNIETRPGEEGNFHVVSSVRAFPIKSTPLLKAMLKNDATRFIEHVDDLLSNEQTRALATNEDTCCAGVGVYFTDFDHNEQK